MQQPRELPVWTWDIKVYRHDGELYRHLTGAIPADTQEEADEARRDMLDEVLVRMYPPSQYRIEMSGVQRSAGESAD